MLDNQEGQQGGITRRTVIKASIFAGAAALLSRCGVKLPTPEQTTLTEPKAKDPFNLVNPVESSNYLWCEPKNHNLETTTNGDRLFKNKEGNTTVAEGILQNSLGIDQWLQSINAPDYEWAGYSMIIIPPDNKEIIHFCGNMMLGEAEEKGGGKAAKTTYANIFTHPYDVFTPAVNFANRHTNMDINKLPEGTRVIVGHSDIVDANLEALKNDPRTTRSTNGILSVKSDFYPGGRQRLQIEYLDKASGWKRVSNPDSPDFLHVDAFRNLPGKNDQLKQDIEWKPPEPQTGISRRNFLNPRSWGRDKA